MVHPEKWGEQTQTKDGRHGSLFAIWGNEDTCISEPSHQRLRKVGRHQGPPNDQGVTGIQQESRRTWGEWTSGPGPGEQPQWWSLPSLPLTLASPRYHSWQASPKKCQLLSTWKENAWFCTSEVHLTVNVELGWRLRKMKIQVRGSPGLEGNTHPLTE